MKITITSTEKITKLDGVQVRVWDGITESGIPCKVFVRMLAVRDDHDATEFEQELRRQLGPGQVVRLSLILDDGRSPHAHDHN